MSQNILFILFMKFDRNGLDASTEFSTELSSQDAKWAFDLVNKYDASATAGVIKTSCTS